jgi:hypothetical protein
MGGMLTGIAAALSAIENAKKLAKNIIDLSRAAGRQEMLVDFNEQILDAQRALFQVRAEYEELAKVKGELERKLLEKKNWKRQAARYELKELAPGILVYAVKPGMEAGEPFHYICPHCMQKQKRSILSLPGPGRGKYVCHQCKFEAVFQSSTIMPVAVRRRSRELDGF